MEKLDVVYRGGRCVKPELLDEWIMAANKNTNDGYSKAGYEAAALRMEILNDESVSGEEAVKRSYDLDVSGGLTGFLAGCMAHTVVHFHPRGAEFKTAWNRENGIGEQKEKELDGVINPAIMTIDTSKI